VLQDFKRFALRGNVLDLAVALIIGAAFTAVVNAFANGILMNLVAAIFGQPSFDSIQIHVGDGALLVGAFLTALVNFVIVAFALFVVVQAFTRLQRRRESGQLREEDLPAPTDEAVLLAEIRDLLRAGR
jgi:large conductance mechanosensitive channel